MGRARSPILIALLTLCLTHCAPAGGIGSRIFIVRRDSGSLSVYDAADAKMLPTEVKDLGNMRHASMVFSKDLRWGYLATRNGQLSRVDLNTLKMDKSVPTSENSIGIAISQDGRYIAVSEYKPGGVTIVDARSMEILKHIPATVEVDGKEVRSRVTGLVDVPGNRFACALMDGAEIWIIDASKPDFPIEYRFATPSPNPFDALVTPEGRFYLTGHFESDNVTLLDLWHPELGVRSVDIRDPELDAKRSAPIKMPHMEAWGVAGDEVFVPLVGEARLAVLDRTTWKFKQSIPLRGNPVYAVLSPTSREIWVTYSGSENDAFIEIIDTEQHKVVRTIEAGRKIYHLAFSPRGDEVYVSANADNRFLVIDANTYEIKHRFEVASPSGIFGPWRAYEMGL
ncbi:MAG: protein nirF [Chrysiogenetes bacterium]|nr:protein nirF [Chrysiogenetes bacterium]